MLLTELKITKMVKTSKLIISLNNLLITSCVQDARTVFCASLCPFLLKMFNF